MEIKKAWLVKVYDEMNNKVTARYLATTKEDIEGFLKYNLGINDYYKIKKVKQRVQ